MKYTDPDGRTITVEGDEAYMKQVEADLQQLCPSASVDYETGVVSVGSVDENNSFSVGTKLVQDLVNDEKHNVKILFTDGGNQAIGYTGSTSRGKGGNTDVQYNPQSNPLINTINKNGLREDHERPAYIGLGHELIHALHNSHGINNQERYYDVIKIDGKSKNYSNGVKYEELATVGLPNFSYGNEYPTENKIRAEHGLGIRNFY